MRRSASTSAVVLCGDVGIPPSTSCLLLVRTGKSRAALPLVCVPSASSRVPSFVVLAFALLYMAASLTSFSSSVGWPFCLHLDLLDLKGSIYDQAAECPYELCCNVEAAQSRDQLQEIVLNAYPILLSCCSRASIHPRTAHVRHTLAMHYMIRSCKHWNTVPSWDTGDAARTTQRLHLAPPQLGRKLLYWSRRDRGNLSLCQINQAFKQTYLTGLYIQAKSGRAACIAYLEAWRTF